MITVRRSDTGLYVVIHEPSQAVIVGEELSAAYARMEELLREHPPTLAEVRPPRAATTRRGAWLVGVGVVALLPFLWLAVLHYTLGRLVDELRERPPAAPAEDVQALRAELEELRQVVSRVEDQVGRSRVGEARSDRTAPPRRPVEQGLEAAVDDDEPGGDESSTGSTDDGPDGDPPDDDDGEEDETKAPKPPATTHDAKRPDAKLP